MSDADKIGKTFMLKRLSVIVTAAIIWQLGGFSTLAKTKDPQQADKFPPSPLEVTTPDPLLPPLRDKRPLTLPEKLQLEKALDELNQEAAAKLQAGDKVSAFEIWNRELRLRRYLGLVAEVQALSRVGDIAWQQSDRQEIQYINQRLQTIEKQAQPKKKNAQNTVDLELLQALGDAYQKLRSPKPALVVYNQVLGVMRQQQNAVGEVDTLKIIAELNLGWFDYPQAASTYEELLKLATAKDDSQDKLIYLQKLAYIYQQTKQPQESVNILSQLKTIYAQQNNLTQLPSLQIALGANYETLAKENPTLLQAAFKNYQEAYTTSWQLQQYARASEAIQKLIPLYRSQGQINEALDASKILLQTESLAANWYGMMQAYDQIGQLYLEQKEYPQSITAFQQGLELAKQLKHQESYFTQQIEKVSHQQ